MSKRHLDNKQALTKANAQTMVNTMPTSHQMPSIIIDINNKHHCHCDIWSLTGKCSNHGHTYHVNISSDAINHYWHDQLHRLQPKCGLKPSLNVAIINNDHHCYHDIWSLTWASAQTMVTHTMSTLTKCRLRKPTERLKTQPRCLKRSPNSSL